jgi:hypothetical protein
MRTPRKVAVVLERGEKRVFAGARAWPGWSRSGKTDDEAIEALLAYAPRYAQIAEAAGLEDSPRTDAAIDVVERLRGGSGTDFGVPGVATKDDAAPLKGAELARQRSILEASWQAFDAAARRAHGKALKLGPRGGGRSLAKMTGHVLEAEIAYLGQLGSRHAKPQRSQDEMALVRQEALAALEALAGGKPVANPRSTKRTWTPRYFIRRSAWHSLDHAWELEDRVEDT